MPTQSLMGRRKPTGRCRIDWTNPLTNGLVAAYLMNEGGRVVYSLVDGNRNTSITGSPVQGPGPFGGPALKFNSSSYFILPGLGTSQSNGTFLMWLKNDTNSPSSTNQTGLINIQTDTLNTHYPWTDGALYFSMLKTSRSNLGSNSSFDKTQWHQLAVTTSPGAGNWKLYQNAKVAYTATGDASFSFPSTFRIGTSDSSYRYMGSQDHMFLWNRTLSQGELQYLYNNPFAFLVPDRVETLSGFSPAAVFLGQNWYSKGDWIGIYGQNGYYKSGSAVAGQGENNLPPYVSSITTSGLSYYTWSPSTADARAMRDATGSSRTAACFYNNSSLSFTVNVTDQRIHKISLYCMDWDTTGRRQTVTVKNASTGDVLDTFNMNFNFNTGVWLSWMFKGSVRFEIAKTAGTNVVLQGFCLDYMPVVTDFGAGFDDGGLMDCYAC